MIAFVGDQVAGIFCCRGEAHGRKILLRLFRVGARIVVSPSSAGRIGATTMTPLSRSTACSGL
jgi:hypothetical protein